MRCPARSYNLYFANNKQASLAFTVAFCFAHAEHNLVQSQYAVVWNARFSSSGSLGFCQIFEDVYLLKRFISIVNGWLLISYDRV